MRLRPFLVTALLLAAGPALAQGFSPAPSQGFGGPAPAASAPRGPSPFGAPQQEPPCFKEFTALRLETEKRGKAIQAAQQHKVSPQEACKLCNALVSADGKFLKYAETNSKACGIPPQIPSQIKENHAKITQVRDRVCQVAAQPARPAGPTLSDALGTSYLPDSSNIKTGRGGTFDTLTGSPLGK
jgi:hypothetical protein